jgi:hypothetical protein
MHFSLSVHHGGIVVASNDREADIWPRPLLITQHNFASTSIGTRRVEMGRSSRPNRIQVIVHAMSGSSGILLFLVRVRTVNKYQGPKGMATARKWFCPVPQ